MECTKVFLAKSHPPILAGSSPEIARQAADKTLTTVVDFYERLTTLVAAFMCHPLSIAGA
jgi:hypothetical protein